MAPAETVGIALRLLPGTKNVVVVGGVAPIDREVLANVKEGDQGIRRSRPAFRISQIWLCLIC